MTFSNHNPNIGISYISGKEMSTTDHYQER